MRRLRNLRKYQHTLVGARKTGGARRLELRRHCSFSAVNSQRGLWLVLQIAIQTLRCLLERTSSNPQHSNVGQRSRPRLASPGAANSRHHVRRRVCHRGSKSAASTFSVSIVPSTSASISTRTEIIGPSSCWAARDKRY